MGKKITTEEWVKKAISVHGKKYDYSKVQYISAKEDVCIICHEHGEFMQRPDNHIHGQGCPKCGRVGVVSSQTITTREFIKKAEAIHGKKYDYSEVRYFNNHTDVCIICPIHGEFWQQPQVHLRGGGCPKCAGKNKTTDDFIKEAIKVHGKKYNYSKSEYKSAHENICIICPEHGEFWQTPANHLRGQGCPKCGEIQRAKSSSKPFDEFVKKAMEIHGNKFDYSNARDMYVNTTTPIEIVCPIHGSFMMQPRLHLKGHGCTKCYHDKKGESQRLDNTVFYERAKAAHGDKYDYSKVKYIKQNEKVCIICHEKDKYGIEHGEFWQLPYSHWKGQGCPKCGGRLVTTQNDFVRVSKAVHGNKYDYSKANYVDSLTKVCIICPEHGEFWMSPQKHYDRGQGCPKCNRPVYVTKQYKFNLLEEFESEYEFRAFLANNDVNILYVILRNIEPKFEPLKRDIERALAHSTEVDPIKALRDKYTSDSEDELDEDEEKVDSNETEDLEAASSPSIDLDDDDAIDSMVATEATKEVDAPTIEDIVKNTQREIKVINKIEHMLTPEDREYIMNKFLNDKRRIWMAARENRK